MKEKMTLFGSIDWLITEAGNRIGQPTPLFFKTLRKAYSVLTVLSGLLLALEGLKQVDLPQWATVANIVFTSVCASGWGQTYLPVKDPTNLPDNPRADGKVENI